MVNLGIQSIQGIQGLPVSVILASRLTIVLLSVRKNSEILALFLIRNRVFYIRIRNDLNIVYVSLVRPIFEYCDSECDCCGSGNAKELKNLPRRTAKIITR